MGLAGPGGRSTPLPCRVGRLAPLNPTPTPDPTSTLTLTQVRRSKPSLSGVARRLTRSRDARAISHVDGKVTCSGSPQWSQPKLGIGALVLSPTRGEIIGGVRTSPHSLYWSFDPTHPKPSRGCNA